VLNRLAAAPAVLVTAAVAAAQALTAGAQAAQPENWRIGFQEPATEGAREIQDFHDLLLVIIIAITIFVTALLLYVVWRYRAKRNPVPRQFTHNTLIEVLWTISWVYTYPDDGGITVYSTMKTEDQLEEGDPYLLAVDNPMVVPVDTNVQLLVTSQDVIHSFGVPSFGLKTDAVSGRYNETWFKAERTGVFYGQCSEICGANHAFMPIEIHVVAKDEFAQWVAEHQTAALD
jgi:cytochrome c oxidase subunit 2